MRRKQFREMTTCVFHMFLESKPQLVLEDIAPFKHILPWAGPFGGKLSFWVGLRGLSQVMSDSCEGRLMECVGLSMVWCW